MWAASFREPVSRTVSHYYQVLPCPDEKKKPSGCSKYAATSYSAFLNASSCSRYVRNHQSSYFPSLKSVLDVDELILNDRFAESLLLLHLRVPSVRLHDLLHTNRKSRVEIVGATIEHEESGEKKLSCTDQWLQKKVSKLKAEAGKAAVAPVLSECTASCAGTLGVELLTKAELEATKKANEKDIALWKVVVEQWERKKAGTLAQGRITNGGFDRMARSFLSVLHRFESNRDTACEEELAAWDAQREQGDEGTRVWQESLKECSAFTIVSDLEKCVSNDVVGERSRKKCRENAKAASSSI